MLLLACRSLFFVAVIFGYSTGVWRLINDYFRGEFKQYLAEEVKQNRYLLVTDPSQLPPAARAQAAGDGDVAGKEPTRQSSVTANRLLDELIIGFGRFFTTRNEQETVGAKSGTNPSKEAPTCSTADNCIHPASDVMQMGTKGDGKVHPAAAAAEEENWINYWKNKPPEGNNGGDSDSGTCERNPAYSGGQKQPIDSCEHNRARVDPGG